MIYYKISNSPAAELRLTTETRINLRTLTNEIGGVGQRGYYTTYEKFLDNPLNALKNVVAQLSPSPYACAPTSVGR